jgi:F-type H+-transporting ATPase subunit epsilon
MNTFVASLVTPERMLLEEEVAAVFLRTAEGDAGFLAGHSPLIGVVVPGVVRFQRADGSEERAAVHGGFVQVGGDTVVVLAPVAELSADIDLERARRSLEAAHARLSELGSASAAEDEEDVRAAAEGAAQRAELRIEVAGSPASAGST